MTAPSEPIVLALPKGRILREALPLLARVGIVPEPAFADEDARQLRFATNVPHLSLVRVRSFDVATFVAYGAAALGVAGSDVILECDLPQLYAPLDLGIGKCRLSVAEPADMAGRDDPLRWRHVRVATKYPVIARRHFANRGVVAECVKLNGAMELAPLLGLTRRIVDLVSTGATLKANGLVEVETIAEVTSRLIVGRAIWRRRGDELQPWIARFAEAAAEARRAA
jgi:ATP phosphoribosyltransferase